MRTRALGTTGLSMTELGLGAAQLGNLYRAVSDETVAETVAVAWEVGVRYFDTAPHYGLGLSERRLGALLAERPRAEFVLSTKAGRLLVPDPAAAGRRDDQGFDVPADRRRVWDFSRDGVRRSLEQSLQRLGLDRVDIVYLHDPDDHWEAASREAVPALAELRDEGVLGAIGAGMNQSAMLAEFVRQTDVDVVMLAGRYTLLEQAALDDLLPLALDRGVGVVNVGVYNSGLLSRPRPRAAAKYDYAPAPAELLLRTNRIADVCERHGVTLPDVALAFGLAHPAVVSVALGASSAAQVRGNVQRYETAVPADVWAELRAEHLLREDAPIPA